MKKVTPHLSSIIRPKKVFVSCNYLNKFLLRNPTTNQHKTCMKHTFFEKIIKKINLPTYPIFVPLQKTNNFFF